MASSSVLRGMECKSKHIEGRRWGWSTNADLRQNIYRGGKAAATTQRAKLEHEISMLQHQIQHRQVVLSAESAYWRLYNVVRALCEEDENPIVSIHDHGSAGHVNCLSELVEECGGLIHMDKLPIGDETLSAKEIIANESQERMGLLIDEKAIEHVRKIAERERAPMYTVGETTGDHRFAFEQADGVRPFDLAVDQMFGSSPKTYMIDKTVERKYDVVTYDMTQLDEYVQRVLQLEAVACKDWLTNKVDRCVTGRIGRQQCQGELQVRHAGSGR